eukprot:SM000123S25816  [mRNA]  locus=s123:67997:70637:+ [translate_table: standard]
MEVVLVGNSFVGTIPTLMTQLRYTTIVSLANNQLTGNVPATIGNLTRLVQAGAHALMLSCSSVLHLFLNYTGNRLSGKPPPAATVPVILGEDCSKGRCTPVLSGSITLPPAPQRPLPPLAPGTPAQPPAPPLLDQRTPLLDLKATLGNPTFLASWIDGLEPCSDPVWAGIVCDYVGRIPTPLPLTLHISRCLQTAVTPSPLFVVLLPWTYVIFLAPPSVTCISTMAFAIEVHTASMSRLLFGLGSLSQALSFCRSDLSNNMLSGAIPLELGNLTELTNLQLPFNKLSGVIPAVLGDLPLLGYVDLGNNNLTGSIPAELLISPSLRSVRLNDNKLFGPVPRIGALGFGLFAANNYLNASNSYYFYFAPENLANNCFGTHNYTGKPPQRSMAECKAFYAAL